MSDIAGTPSSFSDALVAVLPRLTSFACRLTGSRDDGADLVQSACQRALEARHQWRPEARLDSWMYRIIQNLWIDRLRRQKVRGLAETEAPDWMVFDGRSAAESWVMLQKVRSAVEELPREQRDVLELIAVEGCSYKEAARQLEVPVGTVMSRLARARDRLKAQVGWPLSAILLALALGARLPEDAQAAERSEQAAGLDRGGRPGRIGAESQAGLTNWAKALFAMAYLLIALDDDQLQALAADSETWNDLPDLSRILGAGPDALETALAAEVGTPAGAGPAPDRQADSDQEVTAGADFPQGATVASWANLEALDRMSRDAGVSDEFDNDARPAGSADPGGQTGPVAVASAARAESARAESARAESQSGEQVAFTGPEAGAGTNGAEDSGLFVGLGSSSVGYGSSNAGGAGRGYGSGIAAAAYPAALTGSALGDQLVGSAGNDWIQGLDGRDVLIGGDGGDLLEGGAGGDLLEGGAGDDLLIGGSGPDTLFGNAGDDELHGDGLSDSPFGQSLEEAGYSALESAAPAPPVETPVTLPVVGSVAAPVVVPGPEKPAVAKTPEGGGPDAQAGTLPEQANAQGAAPGQDLPAPSALPAVEAPVPAEPLPAAETPPAPAAVSGGPQETAADVPAAIVEPAPDVPSGPSGPGEAPDVAAEPQAPAGGQEAAAGAPPAGQEQGAGPPVSEPPAAEPHIVAPVIEDADADPGGDWEDPYHLLFTIGGDDFLFGGWGNDRMFGGRGIDWLFGGQGDDRLYGGSHGDVLFGGTEDDRLWGNEGDDLLFGGSGDDKAYFSGRLADYQIVGGDPDDLMVTDLRSGAPDGSDRLVDVERLRFEDGTYSARDLAEAYRAALQAQTAHTRGEGAPIGEDELVDSQLDIPLPGSATPGTLATGAQPVASSPLGVEDPLGPSLDDGSGAVQVM